MAKLDLHIDVLDKKTLTRIGKEKDNETVVFHNESDNVLTLTIHHANVLCDNDGPVKENAKFEVNSKTDKSFKVWKDCVPGAPLKYTAQITGFAAEDPIIIIEK